MNIIRIIDDKDIKPSPDTIVTVKHCGQQIEVRYMKYMPTGCPIVKLDKDNCVNTKTGEIITMQHRENRMSDKESIKNSLRKLRDLINCNVKNPNRVLWVTITYADNMTDSVRLYDDFRRFWQRFCYYLKKQGLPKAEYIIAAEPQARGAWHLHCLFIFPKKAPFISNDEVIAKLWGQGFTKTQSLKNIRDVGLYLSSYLANLDVSEMLDKNSQNKAEIDRQEKKERKSVIKGARLNLYPTGFNLYRCSRGIKRPIIFKTTEKQAQKLIGNTPKVYEKTVALIDNETIVNIINYRQYNKNYKSERTDFK